MSQGGGREWGRSGEDKPWGRESLGQGGMRNPSSDHARCIAHLALDMNDAIKGTSRGPEALQSHLNDSYYTNVLCWQ